MDNAFIETEEKAKCVWVRKQPGCRCQWVVRDSLLLVFIFSEKWKVRPPDKSDHGELEDQRIEKVCNSHEGDWE